MVFCSITKKKIPVYALYSTSPLIAEVHIVIFFFVCFVIVCFFFLCLVWLVGVILFSQETRRKKTTRRQLSAIFLRKLYLQRNHYSPQKVSCFHQHFLKSFTINSPVFISDLFLHHPELGRWNICTTCASKDWIHFFFLFLWCGLIMSKRALNCWSLWTSTIRGRESSLLPSIRFSFLPLIIMSVSPSFRPSKETEKKAMKMFVRSFHLLFFKNQYFHTD